MKDFKRREHEEQRPKNAGVHADQNLRHHSKAQRHAAKQQLQQEMQELVNPYPDGSPEWLLHEIFGEHPEGEE